MRTIGALIFPGFELLDMFGPLEMFGRLSEQFEIKMVAETSGSVASAQGPKTVVDRLISEGDRYDLLLVPGGPGTRTEVNNPELLAWLTEASSHTELVLSICTGSALLAKAGLLDGVRATTNKAAFQWVKSQGPRVQWQPQARWVEDGKFFTSSGVSAGMDMSLAVLAKLFGRQKAEDVAVWAEYEWHSDADWDPFSKINGLV